MHAVVVARRGYDTLRVDLHAADQANEAYVHRRGQPLAPVRGAQPLLGSRRHRRVVTPRLASCGPDPATKWLPIGGLALAGFPTVSAGVRARSLHVECACFLSSYFLFVRNSQRGNRLGNRRGDRHERTPRNTVHPQCHFVTFIGCGVTDHVAISTTKVGFRGRVFGCCNLPPPSLKFSL